MCGHYSEVAIRLILNEQGPGNRHCSLRALQGLPCVLARMLLLSGTSPTSELQPHLPGLLRPRLFPPCCGSDSVFPSSTSALYTSSHFDPNIRAWGGVSLCEVNKGRLQWCQLGEETPDSHPHSKPRPEIDRRPPAPITLDKGPWTLVKNPPTPAVAAPGNPLCPARVLSLGPGIPPAPTPALTVFLCLRPSQLTVHIRALPEARTHSPGASSRGAQL